MLVGVSVLGGTHASALEAADANCDGVIDVADVPAIIVRLFEPTNECAGGDGNGDGEVSAADVTVVLQLLSARRPTSTSTSTSTPTTPAPPTSTPSVETPMGETA